MKTLSQILNSAPIIQDANLTEGAAWKMVNTTLRGLGFEAATGHELRSFKGLPKEDIYNLYGIPMRAGKWADVWFAILEDDYAVINDEKIARFEKVGDALKSIQHITVQQKKLATTNEAVEKIACLKCDEVSTAAAWKKNKGFCPVCKVSSQGVSESIELEEKLSADDDAGVWISDFVKSTDPRFEGKSKKERIKMALGAYYAAQNEEVEEVEESITKKQARKITAAQIEKYVDNQDFKALGTLIKHMSKDEYELWSKNGYAGRTYELIMKNREKNEDTQIGDEHLNEEVDYYKFKQLVILGLLSPSDANKAALGMKAIEGGHPPSQEQKRIIGDTLVLLVSMITGDSAILNKLKKTARDAKNATETV